MIIQVHIKNPQNLYLPDILSGNRRTFFFRLSNVIGFHPRLPLISILTGFKTVMFWAVPQNSPACKEWLRSTSESKNKDRFVPIFRTVKATKTNAVIECRTRRTMPITVVTMNYGAVNRSWMVYSSTTHIEIEWRNEKNQQDMRYHFHGL